MHLQPIPLDQLHAHPLSANTMSKRALSRLTSHIRRTGFCPPLIVRPHRARHPEAHGLPSLGLPEVRNPINQRTRSRSARADSQPVAGRLESLGLRNAPDSIDEPTSPASARRAFQIIDGHHRALALRELNITDAPCIVLDIDDARALELLATLNRLAGRDQPHLRAALLMRLREATCPADWPRVVAGLPETPRRLEALLHLETTPPKPRPPRGAHGRRSSVHFFLTPAQRRALESRLRQFDDRPEHALMKLIEAA